MSDEDSFNESTGLSVHQASDLEDFKEEPKEVQKLTGAKKRKVLAKISCGFKFYVRQKRDRRLI